MARPQKITDDEILTAARRCFLEHGPQASTDSIAQELGVSSAALFKRFGTKEQLLWRALAPRPPAFLLELGRGPDGQEPIEEQLHRIGMRFLAFVEEMVPCMLMLHSTVKSRPNVPCVDGVPVPVFVQRGLASWVRVAQERGQLGPGEPAAIAQALIGGAQTRAFLRHLGGVAEGDDNERYMRAMISVLMNGIAPREAPRG